MLTALTGGIGAGKSTVLDIFKGFGASVEDTDTIVHKIYEENEEVHKSLFARWGEKVFSGNIPDRKAIAGLVFNNKKELAWLNGLLHPLVKEAIAACRFKGLTLIAVPLLYEVKWENKFDRVISVWVSQENQIDRLRKRGWSNQEIDSRISAQMDQDEKLNRADYGIINDWSLNSLTRQCRKIYSKLSN